MADRGHSPITERILEWETSSPILDSVANRQSSHITLDCIRHQGECRRFGEWLRVFVGGYLSHIAHIAFSLLLGSPSPRHAILGSETQPKGFIPPNEGSLDASSERVDPSPHSRSRDQGPVVEDQVHGKRLGEGRAESMVSADPNRNANNLGDSARGSFESKRSRRRPASLGLIDERRETERDSEAVKKPAHSNHPQHSSVESWNFERRYGDSTEQRGNESTIRPVQPANEGAESLPRSTISGDSAVSDSQRRIWSADAMGERPSLRHISVVAYAARSPIVQSVASLIGHRGGRVDWHGHWRGANEHVEGVAQFRNQMENPATLAADAPRAHSAAGSDFLGEVSSEGSLPGDVVTGEETESIAVDFGRHDARDHIGGGAHGFDSPRDYVPEDEGRPYSIHDGTIAKNDLRQPFSLASTNYLSASPSLLLAHLSAFIQGRSWAGDDAAWRGLPADGIDAFSGHTPWQNDGGASPIPSVDGLKHKMDLESNPIPIHAEHGPIPLLFDTLVPRTGVDRWDLALDRQDMIAGSPVETIGLDGWSDWAATPGDTDYRSRDLEGGPLSLTPARQAAGAIDEFHRTSFGLSERYEPMGDLRNSNDSYFHDAVDDGGKWSLFPLFGLFNEIEFAGLTDDGTLTTNIEGKPSSLSVGAEDWLGVF